MLFDRISKQNPFLSPKNKRTAIIIRFDQYTFWLLVWIGVPQKYCKITTVLLLYDLKMRFRKIGVHLKLSTYPKPHYQKQAANMILAASTTSTKTYHNGFRSTVRVVLVTGRSDVFETIYFLQLEQVKN